MGAVHLAARWLSDQCQLAGIVAGSCARLPAAWRRISSKQGSSMHASAGARRPLALLRIRRLSRRFPSAHADKLGRPGKHTVTDPAPLYLPACWCLAAKTHQAGCMRAACVRQHGQQPCAGRRAGHNCHGQSRAFIAFLPQPPAPPHQPHAQTRWSPPRQVPHGAKGLCEDLSDRSRPPTQNKSDAGTERTPTHGTVFSFSPAPARR